MHYVGIYAFLSWCPIWATALILYVLTELAMHVGRERTEGVGYQVAYSAKIGDAGLLIAVLIAVTILKRGETMIPASLNTRGEQFMLMLGCVGGGIVVSFLTINSRSGHLMDIYHDVLIGPLFLFSAITLLPVIYRGGTFNEKAAVAMFILIWALLVVYDVKTNRMNQRAWLARRGCVLR